MDNELKYPHFDYVWIAADSLGAIAAFVTAGGGPIPVAIMQIEGNLLPLIARKMLALQFRGEGSMIVSYPRPDSFLALAVRGAFVFDWSDIHETITDRRFAYERVCIPSVPLVVSDLLDELQWIAHQATFKGVSFADEAFLDVREFMDCVERPDK